MKTLRIMAGLWAVVALAVVCQDVCAEEIILKNGQKIEGTIVGYEKDMFRVETAYGIALVRKDKVASILVDEPKGAKAGAPAAQPDAKAAATKPAVASPPVVTAPTAPVEPPRPTPPPPPISRPIDAPMPAHLQEHIDGNTYFSDTFQFSMYKPPDWKVYEGVPKETGSGIMAMGTDDEQTLLIIDRQVWSGPPKLSGDQVEAGLRQTYQGYKRVSEESFQFDGQPALRRTFTGILDGAEWHGVAVHVIHGNMVFGIIGLTSAETFQFQEAIFNKIIKTFHFESGH